MSVDNQSSLHHVTYHLEISGLDAHLVAGSVHLDESLSHLSSASIEAMFESETPIDEQELLSKDATLTIERGESLSHFRGLIRRASIHRTADACQYLHIEVVPALWLLSESRDSRIYQDISVPDLVTQLVGELVGSQGRSVTTDQLTETYPTHEYIVQHRESHYDFLRRICDEEGIFLYLDLDHDSDSSEHEVLVLTDSNTNRPLARPEHEGVIPFEASESQLDRQEVIYRVHRSHRYPSGLDVSCLG